MNGKNHQMFLKVAKTDDELLNAEISTAVLNLKGLKHIYLPKEPSK
jgi:hypothetical protein